MIQIKSCGSWSEMALRFPLPSIHTLCNPLSHCMLVGTCGHLLVIYMRDGMPLLRLGETLS